MVAPIRVLVVDDHTLFRRGLVALLSREPRLSVVAEASDASEALRRAQAEAPDIILLDNHLPGVSGVDALPGLHEVAPGAKVLMLTMSEDADDLARALQGGACGYLLKTAEAEVLIAAIFSALDGDSVVSPEMTTKLVGILRKERSDVRQDEPASPLDLLSPREREILRALATGASNKEIARSLDIAETTVKVHVQSVLRKLNMTSRVQAAVLAVELRLI